MSNEPSGKDEILIILTELGLTLLQAKIYFALSRLENVTIKTIAKAADVARQDAYRLMPTLEKLGLAERVLTDPVSFMPTPLLQGVDILLRLKTVKYKELQKKSHNLGLKFGQTLAEKSNSIDEEKIIIISEETILEKTYAQDFMAAKISSSLIAAKERHRLFLRWGTTSGQIRQSLKRGVKIRIITEMGAEMEEPLRKVEKTLMKNPLFETRYISSVQPISLTIDDQKIVTIALRDPPNLDVPSLWTNNPHIAILASNYFEELWRKAKRNSRRAPSKPENTTLITN